MQIAVNYILVRCIHSCNASCHANLFHQEQKKVVISEMSSTSTRLVAHQTWLPFHWFGAPQPVPVSWSVEAISKSGRVMRDHHPCKLFQSLPWLRAWNRLGTPMWLVYRHVKTSKCCNGVAFRLEFVIIFSFHQAFWWIWFLSCSSYEIISWWLFVKEIVLIVLWSN